MAVVFTKQLVERTGELGDVMASFLEEQIFAIQQATNSTFAKVPDDAVWKTLSAFATLEGTKIPMSRTEIGGKVDLKQNQLDFILNSLEEARIIRLADGIYELAHDTLALKVADKRSTEEIALLEVEKLINDRYLAFATTGTLLSRRELNYIEPHKPKLRITPEQKAFIRKSDRASKRRRGILWAAIIAAFAIISILGIQATIQANNARKNAKEAEEQRDNAKKAELEAIKNKDEALKQKGIADQASRAARDSARVAIEQRELAVQAEEEARRQQQIARDSALAAQEQRKIARDSALAAQLQRRIARDSTIAARKARANAVKSAKAAQKAREEALRNLQTANSLRKKGLAQALSIKSRQIENPIHIKGILAREAYSILRSGDGDKDDSDMYNGLYHAVKAYQKEEFDEIQTHTGMVQSIAISSDSNTIYSVASDGKLLKLEITKWNDIGLPNYVTTEVQVGEFVEKGIALSSDDKWLAVGGKKSILQIFNKNKSFEKPEDTYNLHDRKDVLDVQFLNDNQHIITTGADRKIVKLNLAQREATTLATLPRQAEKLAINPITNDIICGGRNSGLWLVTPDGTTRKRLAPQGVPITALAFGQAGKWLLIGYSNGLMEKWEHKNGTYVKYKSSQRHFQEITSFDVTSDRFVSTSNDGTAKVWNFERFGQELYEPITLEDNKPWASVAKFVKGNRVLVGYKDGTLKFWTLESAVLADKLCDVLKGKNLTEDERERYIGTEVEYQSYCQ